MKLLMFFLSAIWYRVAYINLDGTLLYRMRCAPHVKRNHIQWWVDNLTVRPVVKDRMRICWWLHRIFRVRLIIWTNRMWHHTAITFDSLGDDANLFHHVIWGNGQKPLNLPYKGPCMDDQAKYTKAIGKFSLLVEQL